jgi:hypothetical protein
VDENSVRTMLDALAGTEAPQARFDIGDAVYQGRRGRRMRRVKAGSSALAVVAVLGAIFALVLVPRRPADQVPPGGPSACASMPASAPVAFSPLMSCVSFGWLPGGYSVDAPDSGSSVQRLVSRLTVVRNFVVISLTVGAKGTCRTTGSVFAPVLTCDYQNGAGSHALTAVSRAPDVTGRPAYWDRSGRLFWEYAPGGWAVADFSALPAKLPPARTADADLLRIAGTVRYGSAVPIRFPYWVTGLPAKWRVTIVTYRERGGVPLGTDLTVAPGNSLIGIGLDVQPGPVDSCAYMGGGQSRRVTVDGVPAVLDTIAGRQQALCIRLVRGYSVLVLLQLRSFSDGKPLPGEGGLGGPAGIAQRMHFLPLDPAGWTTSPIR